MQAASAVDRALEFWMVFVASRHFCLAAATALPEPAVVEGVDEEVVEVLELPHALTAAAARTSTTRSGERRPIMPPSSRKPSRTVEWSVRAAESPADREDLAGAHPRRPSRRKHPPRRHGRRSRPAVHLNRPRTRRPRPLKPTTASRSAVVQQLTKPCSGCRMSIVASDGLDLLRVSAVPRPGRTGQPRLIGRRDGWSVVCGCKWPE